MMLGSIHAAAASLVPPNVGTGSELGKGGDVVAHSRAACVDLLHHCRREVRLDGSVHRRAHDLPPRRAQHDLHRLRIEPKIKLVLRIIYKLRRSLGILVVCINTPTSVGWLPNTAYS